MSDKNDMDKIMKDVVYELRIVNMITILNLIMVLSILGLGGMYWYLNG